MAAASSTSLQRRPEPQPSAAIELYNRNARDPDQITALLIRANEQCHLVSPAAACGELPEGFSVAFSSVLVSGEADTYDTKDRGKRGLHRHVLDRIGAAAGVSWDSRRSRRLDDGRDPHYCAFQAVGHYRHFDGTEVEIIGTKEMDLRKESAQIDGKDPKEIGMLRRNIVSHAETKARLRAIAAMGVKRAYTAEELKKPFVVARLMFTGQTKDPELRRDFAMLQAKSFLEAKDRMYGPPETVAIAAPISAPPVGSSIDDAPDPKPVAAAPAPRASTEGTLSSVVIPWGRHKGQPVCAVDDDYLQWLGDAVRGALDDPAKARFRADNEKLLRAIEAEEDRRSGPSEDTSASSNAGEGEDELPF